VSGTGAATRRERSAGQCERADTSDRGTHERCISRHFGFKGGVEINTNKIDGWDLCSGRHSVAIFSGFFVFGENQQARPDSISANIYPSTRGGCNQGSHTRLRRSQHLTFCGQHTHGRHPLSYFLCRPVLFTKQAATPPNCIKNKSGRGVVKCGGKC
jgi:hypothetical protein